MDERDFKAMNEELNPPSCLGAVRVCFYIHDYNEVIWTILPARVNNGDSFFMDCFVGEREEKTLKPQTYEDMIEGAILYCSSSVWGRDENGVYQQVYLVDELPAKRHTF